jgi:hypothetical protein
MALVRVGRRWRAGVGTRNAAQGNQAGSGIICRESNILVFIRRIRGMKDMKLEISDENPEIKIL